MKENSNKVKGFLVVNRFLNSGKFQEIYDFLLRAAAKYEIELELIDNASLISETKIAHYAKEYDFCLFWDKDILLAKALQEAGIRIYNSPEAIQICDDKLLTYEALKNKGILMPKTLRIPFTFENIGYNDFSFLEEIGDELSYPFIIKETKGSFGAQVYMANTPKEAEEILIKTGARAALAQEYISESCGRDVRVNMVGLKACTAMERFHASDFRANVTNGGQMKPHEVTPQELMLSQKVMDIIGLDFAGVDILFSKEGPMLCEVNSNAHFKNIYDCTGINIADSIMEYIYAGINSL